MLISLQIVIIVILLAIFIQDMRLRAVYWTWFPLLSSLFALQYIINNGLRSFCNSLVWNVVFLLLQLAVLSMWFSVRNKRWINITHHLIGLGDILFVVSATFYFPFVNYVIFYVISLAGSLLLWVFCRGVRIVKNDQMPLAGLQAAQLAGYIIVAMLFSADLTSDNWLVNLLIV